VLDPEILCFFEKTDDIKVANGLISSTSLDKIYDSVMQGWSLTWIVGSYVVFVFRPIALLSLG